MVRRNKRNPIRVFLKFFLGFLVLILFAAAVYIAMVVRDRHKGYHVDINRKAQENNTIRAGFATRDISPVIKDTWIDVNNNYRFDPDNGDTWEDVTGTGRFDGVWMAGFQSSKPATGVHDPLWARAMAIDDGHTKLVWVVLDAIGLFGCDVIDIRKAVPADMGIDYLIVSSTHTHSAPDLMGLWGPRRFKSGVDPDYLDFVKKQSLAAVEAAVENLRPAKFRFASDRDGAAEMIADTRKPHVVNPELFIMQVLDLYTDETLGTLVIWDNHPETIWNNNLFITSDFPHFMREGIEKGVWVNDSLGSPGLGGIAIFATGNIGGLMTTSPEIGITGLAGDTVYFEPSFQKVEAQGLKLAQLVIDALNAPGVTEITSGGIELRAQSIELPLDNYLFKLGLFMGIFDRGMTGWMKFRSEIAFWRLGPASFLHHPGELYPEIADGGIEAPVGQDYETDPVEVPPLREIMPGRYKFIAGLSNDMIGYIIPKSQWDAEPPYTYGYESRPYGEVNSLGPETGPVIHDALKRIILNE
jgi:hypothetical protein